MTNEEYIELITQFQNEYGLSKEDIAIGFFSMFYDDKINREQLDALLSGIGFAVSDDYATLSDEELKKRIFKKEKEPKEGLSKEEIEAAKTCKGGDKAPEAFKGLNYDQIMQVVNFLEEATKDTNKKTTAKMVCVEFVNGNFTRRQLDYGLHKLGISLSPKFREMSDDELRKNLFKKRK